MFSFTSNLNGFIRPLNPSHKTTVSTQNFINLFNSYLITSISEQKTRNTYLAHLECERYDFHLFHLNHSQRY